MYVFNLFLKTILPVKLVVLVLVSFSIISWAIIIQRTRVFNTVMHEIKEFEKKFWSSIELSRLYRDTQHRCDKLTGIEQIFYSGFKEFTRLCHVKNSAPEALVEGASRAMCISMKHELEMLEKYIVFLGTIGSVSPYIGLFGTVCEITHAFISFNEIKNAILQTVAPDLAQSLIVTAISLFVAIPANVAYNCLNRYIDKLGRNYDNFMEEFLAILHRKVFNHEKDNR